MIFRFRRHRLSGLNRGAGKINIVFGELSTRVVHCTRFSPSDPHHISFPATPKSKSWVFNEFWWILVEIHQKSKGVPLDAENLDFDVTGKQVRCGSLGLKRVQWRARVEISPKPVLVSPAH